MTALTLCPTFTLACACALACAGELDGDESEYRASRGGPGDATAPSAPADSGGSAGSTGGTGGCDHEDILQRTCALTGCHASSVPAGGLDLQSPNVEGRLVDAVSTHVDCPDRVLVSSASVEQSLLLEKLEPGVPQCGERMPIVGQLDAAELACLESWIRELGGAGGTAPTGDAAP